MIFVFAIARVALGFKAPPAGDEQLSAVAIVKEYLDAFIAAGLVVLLLTTFVIRTYYIPSISMIPTLAIHDLLLVDEFDYRLHTPQPLDIAVFTPPVESQGDEFIKRVVGVPGDTIAIREGIVYRNGRALVEPYENEQPAYDLEIKNYGIYVDGTRLDPSEANIPPRSMWQAANRIPQGFFFMLGDNRNYSDDSHVWGFAQMRGRFASGPLASHDVQSGFVGRAFIVFWPFGRIQILH